MDINKKYLDVVVNWKRTEKAYGDPDEAVDPGFDDPNYDPDMLPQDSANLTDRQRAEADAYTIIVATYGPYNQGNGPDGCNYDDDHAIAAEGICCQNCIFYEGAGACNIVEGFIDPLGICSKYVIPQDVTATGDALFTKAPDTT